MSPLDSVLEQLAPAAGWSSDWQEVLGRAGVTAVPRRRAPRRLVLAFAIVAAILVPLAAVAASRGWWFFAGGVAPQPTHAPVVVKSGDWDGHAWQLIAYPSTTDGLCFSVVPTASIETGTGSAMDCNAFVGVPRTAATKATPDMPITYLSSSGTAGLPAYIAGPVIESATSIEIRLSDGTNLTTPTFNAPAPLEDVRFYATQLPSSTGRTLSSPISWIAGVATDGTIVACLAPATAHGGISPLDACR